MTINILQSVIAADWTEEIDDVVREDGGPYLSQGLVRVGINTPIHAGSIGTQGYAIGGPIAAPNGDGCALVSAVSGSRLGWTVRPPLVTPFTAASDDGDYFAADGTWKSIAGIGPSAIFSALGFTPVNKAGDTGIGVLGVQRLRVGTSAPVASEDGKVYAQGMVTDWINYDRAMIQTGANSNLTLDAAGTLKLMAGRDNSAAAKVQSAGGLNIRNYGDTADAALTASSATFSGTVVTGAVKASSFYSMVVLQDGLGGNQLGVNNNGVMPPGQPSGGFWLVGSGVTGLPYRFLGTGSGFGVSSASTGSQSVYIHTDGAEAVRFGGSNVSRRTTFAGGATFQGGGNGGIDIDGNIVPWYVGSHSLGNASNPWKDIYQQGAVLNYNTGFSGSSNYERGYQRWNSNVYEIGTEKAGTGTDRSFRISSGNSVFIHGGTIHVATINTNGIELKFGNLYPTLAADIGVNGAGTIWRSLYLSNEVVQNNAGFVGNTNYERGYHRWTSNVYQIGSEAGGTGVVRDVDIKRGNGTSLNVSSGVVNVLDGNGGHSALRANAFYFSWFDSSLQLASNVSGNRAVQVYTDNGLALTLGGSGASRAATFAGDIYLPAGKRIIFPDINTSVGVANGSQQLDLLGGNAGIRINRVGVGDIYFDRVCTFSSGVTLPAGSGLSTWERITSNNGFCSPVSSPGFWADSNGVGLGTSAYVAWGSGDAGNVGAFDAKLVRNTTGQLDVRADGGLRVVNFTNGSFTNVRAGTFQAANDLFVGYVNNTVQDCYLTRSANGRMDICGANGVRVRTYGGGASAKIEASQFVSPVSTAAAPAVCLDNANNTGIAFLSNTVGSREIAISTDGAEAIRFGGSGTSRATTFSGSIIMSDIANSIRWSTASSSPRIYADEATWGPLSLTSANGVAVYNNLRLANCHLVSNEDMNVGPTTNNRTLTLRASGTGSVVVSHPLSVNAAGTFSGDLKAVTIYPLAYAGAPATCNISSSGGSSTSMVLSCGGTQQVALSDGKFNIPSAWSIEFSSGNWNQPIDARMIRSAANQLDVRCSGGFRVRNLGNTGDANLQAGDSYLANTTTGILTANQAKFWNSTVISPSDGLLQVRGDGGAQIRNAANTADAALTAGAFTSSSGISGVNYLCNASGYFAFNGRASFESTADGKIRIDNAAHTQGVILDVSNSTLVVRNRGDTGGTNLQAYTGIFDIIAGAAGNIEIRGNSGVQIRNAAGSADAALTAGTGTFGGTVAPSVHGIYNLGTSGARWQDALLNGRVQVGAGIAVNPSMTFGAATDTGIWLASAVVGSRAVVISTDGVEAARFGGSGTGRLASFAGSLTTTGTYNSITGATGPTTHLGFYMQSTGNAGSAAHIDAGFSSFGTRSRIRTELISGDTGNWSVWTYGSGVLQQNLTIVGATREATFAGAVNVAGTITHGSQDARWRIPSTSTRVSEVKTTTNLWQPAYSEEASDADGVKLALYGGTRYPQLAAAGVTSGHTAGTGATVADDSTFTGGVGTTAYTIGDVVKALKELGKLAM